MSEASEPIPGELMEALRSGRLSEEQAREIFRCGEKGVVFALLWLNKALGDQPARRSAESGQTPGTPSGMQPVRRKSNSSTIKLRGRKREA